MLWSVGIHHGDISEDNMMWDPVTQKPKLCDFHLSHFCDSSKLDGGKCFGGSATAGTWRFMASELLTPHAMKGNVKRVYRHEVEAFVHVLVWVVCRYADGNLKVPPPLQEWNQTNYVLVLENRNTTIGYIKDGTFPQPPGLPIDLWNVVRSTLCDLNILVLDAGVAQHDQWRRKWDREYAERCDPSDLDDYNTLRALRQILGWRLFDHPSAECFVKLIKERIPQASDTQRRSFGLAFLWDYIRRQFS